MPHRLVLHKLVKATLRTIVAVIVVVLKECEILKFTGHRPYALPVSPYLAYQEWHNVLFLHYQFSPKEVQALLPKPYIVDVIDGGAWISIVAFRVKKLKPRQLPWVPWLSSFNEVNVRTYISVDGKPGIYFLDIRADKVLQLLMARVTLKLHYQKAAIETHKEQWLLDAGDYNFRINYRASSSLFDDKLSRWLAERYCMYLLIENKPYRYNIHHLPWRLQHVDINSSTINYNQAQIHLGCGNVALAHYSCRQQVLMWGREEVAFNSYPEY